MVKAFNALRWDRLRDDGRPAGDPKRVGIPISGDDESAKLVIAELIDQIGFDPVDAGTLAEGGRKHQTGSPIDVAGLRAGGAARPSCRLTGGRSWSAKRLTLSWTSN